MDGWASLSSPPSQKPHRSSGIPCWPWQQSAVVTGTFVSSEPGRTFQAANALGEMEETPLGGTIRFAWPQSTSETDANQAKMYELIGTPNGDGSLFVVFADATSGGESYGGGRFLSVSLRMMMDESPSISTEVSIHLVRSHPSPRALDLLSRTACLSQLRRGETPREH